LTAWISRARQAACPGFFIRGHSLQQALATDAGLKRRFLRFEYIPIEFPVLPRVVAVADALS